MEVFLGANNITSPLGFTTKENFDALLVGKTGLKKTSFKFSDQQFCCATIDDSQLESRFKSISGSLHHTRLEKMCLISISDVIKQSNIDLKDKSTLLIISTTKGNVDLLESSIGEFVGREYLSSFANAIAKEFSCFNEPMVVSNACISGLLAMIIAKRLISNGNYKNIIVCGADLVSEFTLSGFKSFNALSPEPCKPFDANRIGINLGEAAASIVLSSEKISDIIIKAGSSANDANHISGPSRTGDGLFQAITQTLSGSGDHTPDFISAHGTATEYNDEMESAAFERMHLNNLPVNSLKGYYGHTLGAAGVVESIIAIESLKNNVLIKSQGFETKGTTHLNHVILKNKNQSLRSCLKTASGFGGCNAAALFEKI